MNVRPYEGTLPGTGVDDGAATSRNPVAMLSTLGAMGPPLRLSRVQRMVRHSGLSGALAASVRGVRTGIERHCAGEEVRVHGEPP